MSDEIEAAKKADSATTAFKEETDDEGSSSGDKKEASLKHAVRSSLAAAEKMNEAVRTAAEKAENDEALGEELNRIFGAWRFQERRQEREEEKKKAAKNNQETGKDDVGDQSDKDDDDDSDDENEPLKYRNHMYIPKKPRIKIWGDEPSVKVLGNGSCRPTTNFGGFSMNFGLELLRLHPSGLVLVGETDDEPGLRGYIVDHDGDDIAVIFHGAEGNYTLRTKSCPPNQRDQAERMIASGFRSVEIVKKIQGDPLGIELIALQDKLELERLLDREQSPSTSATTNKSGETEPSSAGVSWRQRFEELAALAEASGLDGERISAIRSGQSSAP